MCPVVGIKSSGRLTAACLYGSTTAAARAALSPKADFDGVDEADALPMLPLNPGLDPRSLAAVRREPAHRAARGRRGGAAAVRSPCRRRRCCAMRRRSGLRADESEDIVQERLPGAVPPPASRSLAAESHGLAVSGGAQPALKQRSGGLQRRATASWDAALHEQRIDPAANPENPARPASTAFRLAPVIHALPARDRRCLLLPRGRSPVPRYRAHARHVARRCRQVARSIDDPSRERGQRMSV